MGISRFGAALRERRKRLKLSQGELAELSGVNREQISRIEQGQVSPMLGTMDKLLDAVGWKLSDLAKMIEGHAPPDHPQVAEPTVTYDEAAELKERVAKLEAELDTQRRLAAVERRQAMLDADREAIKQEALRIVREMLAAEVRAGRMKG